jgi:hypothetical protein
LVALAHDCGRRLRASTGPARCPVLSRVMQDTLSRLRMFSDAERLFLGDHSEERPDGGVASNESRKGMTCRSRAENIETINHRRLREGRSRLTTQITAPQVSSVPGLSDRSQYNHALYIRQRLILSAAGIPGPCHYFR